MSYLSHEMLPFKARLPS